MAFFFFGDDEAGGAAAAAALRSSSLRGDIDRSIAHMCQPFCFTAGESRGAAHTRVSGVKQKLNKPSINLK